jgi:hypothetical protein
VTDATELYYTHMESDRSEAEEAYFKARPSLGTEVDRALFRSGFERAYAKLWPLAIIQIDEQQRAAQETSAAPAHVHSWTPNAFGGAVCKCGTHAYGWYCPTSPTKLCVYAKSFDSCDYCGDPEERK